MIIPCVCNEHGHLQKLESSLREHGLLPASCSTFSISSNCTQLKPLHYLEMLLRWKCHREVKLFDQECFWLLNRGGGSLFLWDRQHLLKSRGKEETNMVWLRRNHVQREISWAPHVGNGGTLIELVVEDQILVSAPLFSIRLQQHITSLKLCFLVRKVGLDTANSTDVTG